MSSDSSAEGQPKARQNKQCRTWWPHCVMWMAAMWAIDRCDWRRATGRKSKTRGGWSVDRLTCGDGDGLRSLGFGVGLGFQIDIIYAVTNRRLKDSKRFQRLDSYFKVGWVFPGEPSHDIPCLLLQKWTRYCCFHYHIQPPSGPFMSTLWDMFFSCETRLSKWSLAAGS